MDDLSATLEVGIRVECGAKDGLVYYLHRQTSRFMRLAAYC